MKIVLTGITGFVGQELMPMLQKDCTEHEFLSLKIDVNDAEIKYSCKIYTILILLHSTDL